MNPGRNISLNDIRIRNEFKPGDSECITRLHGKIYRQEYQYTEAFENYVAAGFKEFNKQYDSKLDRVWVCEYQESIIGFVLIMHRENNTAQLRFFILLPEYRKLGLGKKLMKECLDFLRQVSYKKVFLWTTNEQGTAAALYTQSGFVLREEKDSTAFGKPLKEQRYELLLNEELSD